MSPGGPGVVLGLDFGPWVGMRGAMGGRELLWGSGEDPGPPLLVEAISAALGFMVAPALACTSSPQHLRFLLLDNPVHRQVWS